MIIKIPDNDFVAWGFYVSTNLIYSLDRCFVLSAVEVLANKFLHHHLLALYLLT